MKAVDIKATRDYIPECDRKLKASEQSVFELGMLSVREERLLENTVGMNTEGQMFMNIGDQHYLALCMGLKGVRNFIDAEGNEVVVEREKSKIHGVVRPLTDSFLQKIPKEVRLEIAREIIDGSGSEVSEEEVKNS